MKIKPLHDRVLILREEEIEKTKGGILLAGASKEKSNQGTVAAVGPGKILENGEHSPMSVKVGDTVVFASYAGSQTIKDGENEYVFMEEKDIYGVLTNK